MAFNQSVFSLSHHIVNNILANNNITVVPSSKEVTLYHSTHQEENPSYLWVPYFLMTCLLLSLTFVSFVKFHLKNKNRYGDRKSVLHQLQHLNIVKRSKRSSLSHCDNSIDTVINSHPKNNSSERHTSVSKSVNVIDTNTRGPLQPTTHAEQSIHIANHQRPIPHISQNFHARFRDHPSTDDDKHSYNNKAYDSRDDICLPSPSTAIGSFDVLITNRLPHASSVLPNLVNPDYIKDKHAVLGNVKIHTLNYII